MSAHRSAPRAPAAPRVAAAAEAPTFHAVGRRLVSDAVHDQLRLAILDGSLAPGSALPAERVLAEDFGVNRHAVREAIKRLQQARLVEVAHGGATRVLDWRRTAGLEVLPDLASFGPGRLPDADVLRAALEMRQGLGADVARRCAERPKAALAADLWAHVAATRAALAGGQPAELLSDRYAELWHRLVDGSGNVAYRLAYNSLLDALDRIPELARAASEEEFRDADAQEALVDAIAAGQPERAAAVAGELLGRMLANARRLLPEQPGGRGVRGG